MCPPHSGGDLGPLCPIVKENIDMLHDHVHHAGPLTLAHVTLLFNALLYDQLARQRFAVAATEYLDRDYELE